MPRHPPVSQQQEDSTAILGLTPKLRRSDKEIREPLMQTRSRFEKDLKDDDGFRRCCEKFGDQFGGDSLKPTTLLELPARKKNFKAFTLTISDFESVFHEALYKYRRADNCFPDGQLGAQSTCLCYSSTTACRPSRAYGRRDSYSSTAAERNGGSERNFSENVWKIRSSSHACTVVSTTVRSK